jgi:CheY-like chemotaxis protein
MKLPQKAKEYMLNAQRCGELLLNLMNNILDTAKAEIGELEINRTEISMQDALQNIWGICSQMIRTKTLTGVIKISKKLPSVLLLDNYRLMQVIMNLMGNATKFTDKGFINITIDWIPNKPKIDDSCYLPEPYLSEDEGIFEKDEKVAGLSGDYLVASSEMGTILPWRREPCTEETAGIMKISIMDSGCGIKEDDLDKLFRQFSQVTLDPSRKKLGSGLGLFITRLICEKMGGEVKIYSREHRGTTFSFCIPAMPKPSSEIFEEPVLTATKKIDFVMNTMDAQKLTVDLMRMQSHKDEAMPNIMLVDDEDFIKVIIESHLNKLNLAVYAKASDGTEAYDLYYDSAVNGRKIDIIFMDINMGKMDGKTAAKKIRRLEEEQDLEPCTIFMVSAACLGSQITECLDPEGQIRAKAFLKKPVTFENIKEAKLEEICH